MATLSDESRLFLEPPGLVEHAGAGGLDLYLACERLSPGQWLATVQDLRLLLHAVLPEADGTPVGKVGYEQAWRGVWRLVNLLQDLPGFHVEIDGLETLPPPDMAAGTEAPEAGLRMHAWTEARALCDDIFHPLIAALIAAGVPGPDHIGDDLVVAGRVVGAMEFGWSQAGVALADARYAGVCWTLIAFDPESDPGHRHRGTTGA